MRIQAAILERPDGRLTRHKIQIEDVELEAPRDDEVLIKVTSCGVCGTDRGCIHGIEPYPSPGVLGHEGAGIVEDIGSSVTLVKRGDRVVIGFPFCGVYRYCRAGQMRYCQHGNELMFGGRRLDSDAGSVVKPILMMG